jgi:lipid II:glycine glycyltransferase (peptidoglycan interpeptide bridge formation enzyme)
MEVREIKKDRKNDWDSFILRNCSEGFLQSFGWGEFQSLVGRKVLRFACCEKRMLAAASVIEHKLPFGMRYWYLPRGPVAAADATEKERIRALEALLRFLRKAAKKNGVIFVRMDPPVPAERRGEWERLGLKPITGSVQPKDTLLLDLAREEEDILGGMKPKTRYNIRLARKKGVAAGAEKFSEENFGEFWKLMEETSRRDGIVLHGREYYRQMLRALEAEGGALRCRLYLARYEGRAIAANLVLFFGDYAVYLHGASSSTLRNLMAPYLLQWKQICDAKAAGCRTYDFWGITVGDRQPRWEGITRFKKGFGGKEASYAGVFDLVINRFFYGLYTRFRKIR